MERHGEPSLEGTLSPVFSFPGENQPCSLILRLCEPGNSASAWSAALWRQPPAVGAGGWGASEGRWAISVAPE